MTFLIGYMKYCFCLCTICQCCLHISTTEGNNPWDKISSFRHGNYCSLQNKYSRINSTFLLATVFINSITWFCLNGCFSSFIHVQNLLRLYFVFMAFHQRKTGEKVYILWRFLVIMVAMETQQYLPSNFW